MMSFLTRAEFWVLALAGAAFLVLYWALRGAPIGQLVDEEDRGDKGDEAPRAAYRDRVIAAVVAGLLLVVAGAYIALTHGIPWSLPPFAVGFGIVLTLIAVNRRYRHASPALRRTVEFSNTALTATLVAGVLIVVNVLAFRYGGRALDFTRERAFSLSSLTLNQLANLERPVTLTLFFGESPLEALQSDRVRQLLDLYKAANPKLVRVEHLRRYAEPDRFDAITKRVPDVAVTQGGGILIEYGEGENPPHVVIRNSDLFDLPRSAQVEANTQRLESKFHGESAVTSALINLREDRKPRVVFTTGHGEPSLDVGDPRQPGLGIWKARLAATGWDVREINLLHDEVPTDVSLLVIVAPKTPFKNEEVAKLKAYSDRGGPALILAGNQDKTGLDDFLKPFNVQYGNGMVIDRAMNWNRRPQFVYAPIGGLRHPIVDPLTRRFALVVSAAPLRLLGTGGSSANPNMVPAPLLRTSNQSWAETDFTNPSARPDKGKDEAGPLTVAVAVTERATPDSGEKDRPRLVLFSSGAMAENMVVGGEDPTNQDLLMNAIGWLRGRADLKGVGPSTHEAMTLVADPVLRARLIMVPTVMAVLLIIGLGAITYVARRE